MSYNTRKKLKGTFFILPAFLIHVIVIVIPALSHDLLCIHKMEWIIRTSVHWS